MLSKNVIRLAYAAVLLLASTAAAQEDSAAKTEKPSFSEAVAKAKESGLPLVVFGVSEGCSRCAALKEGITNEPELKLLLTQYVATEIPFGGREFGNIFGEIVIRDSTIPRQIGAPSVFIFTSAGETVYAGPNRESGIAPDPEFKKLLISGIQKNGGVRAVAGGKAAPLPSLNADLTKARKLLDQNQTLAAAALMAKHVQPAAESEETSDEQVAAVVKLTGLKIARSKGDEQLDSLVMQLTEKGESLVTAAVSLSTTDATKGAVRLAELNRAYEGYSSLISTFDDAWKAIEEKSGVPNVKEQALLIDRARAAEAAGEKEQAITSYQEVVTSYPGTQAAKLSELRLSQLQPQEPVEPRVWKSKDGKFSVTATLISFDGVKAQLKKEDGKTIAVPLDVLSAVDQQFLRDANAVK